MTLDSRRARFLTFVGAGSRWLYATFDVRDCLLALGLGLLATGLARVWVPAAFIVPGAVLTYVAILGNRAARPASPQPDDLESD